MLLRIAQKVQYTTGTLNLNKIKNNDKHIFVHENISYKYLKHFKLWHLEKWMEINLRFNKMQNIPSQCLRERIVASF